MLAWLVNTAALLVAAHVIEGISYDAPLDLVAATLLLGILNAVVRPVLMLLSIPLLLLSLGLFTLVINAGLLLLVGELIKGFHVTSFWAACKGAILVSILSMLFYGVTGLRRIKVNVQKPNVRPPRGKSYTDDDPNIIDV